MVYVRGFFLWLILMLAETVHGIARTVLIEPHVGDFRARQIAVFTGSVIILTITTALIRWIRAHDRRQLLVIGLLWLGLTLSFEIGFGRIIFGYPWERILSDYDVRKGGLLPVGLFVLTVSPLLAAKIRGIFDPRPNVRP